ncbi:MAG: hypothetical protein QUS14_00815 [Pyrinomonadaceae bacterium]|nr:hypothetical protein [Pyrinomonadaceae bacterium]
MPRTPVDIFKEQITNTMREIKGDPSLQINFQAGTLSQHVATDKQARIAMLSAAISSARRLGFNLNTAGVAVVFNGVNRQSRYSTVLGVFNTAVTTGADPLVP